MLTVTRLCVIAFSALVPVSSDQRTSGHASGKPAAKPPYQLVPEDPARGAVLLEKALQAFGGAVAVDGVRTLELRGTSVRHFPNASRMTVETVTYIAPPDRYRHEVRAKGTTIASVLDGTGAFVLLAQQVLPMPSSEAAALRASVARHPVLLLRARHEPGYRPVLIGTATVNGTNVEMLTVRSGSDATTLYVDPATGRVLRATYAAQFGNRARQAAVEYGDYRRVEGGLVYPFVWSGTFDDEPAFETTMTSVTVNGKLDEALFSPPAPPPSPRPSPSP
jgi:hypothetical protein